MAIVDVSLKGGRWSPAPSAPGATDWEQSGLSHHIGRMERRGLVERSECPTDSRGTVMSLAALADVLDTLRRHLDRPRWAADAVAQADVVVLAIPLHRFPELDSDLVATPPPLEKRS